MNSTHPPARMRLATVLLLGGAVSACLQSDQALPFELDEELAVTRAVGPAGGTMSLPSGVSLVVPPGALDATVQIGVAQHVSFGNGAGAVIPGTTFQITPAGTRLKPGVPARLQLLVPATGLNGAELVRLGVAEEVQGRIVLLEGGAYDATSGILSAPVATLGTVAAVIALDAVTTETGTPVRLEGGSFGVPTSGAPALGVSPLSGTFQASCGPTGRRCFSSGLVRAWVSDNLKERVGAEIAILNPTLSADLRLDAVDAAGLPTQVTGSVRVTGELRARMGESIVTYRIDESLITGPTGIPTTTAVRVQGNTMILAQTSDGPNHELEYAVRAVGTGQMLLLRLEQDVNLETAEGSTTGKVILHVRLRR